MRRSPTTLLAALAAAALLLAGCSGGDSATSESAAGAGGSSREAGGAAPDEDGIDSGGGSGGGGGGGGGGKTAPDDPTAVLSGRGAAGASFVRTAELAVRVDDVRRAADAAGRLVSQAGGLVESEERSRAEDDGSALVVLRVPPSAFASTLTRLAELGEEVDRRVSSTNVHEQVVDLTSRTATQRASVARVTALLDRAGSIGEIVQVEAELTRRTAELESLEARRAALEGQVELSTITLHLTGDDGAVLADSGPRGFGDGLAAGWSALLTLGRAVGVSAGAVLPFLPLLLAGALLWRLRVRRTARSAPPAGG